MFKSMAHIQKYLYERTGCNVRVEKRRSKLHFYYIDRNEIGYWSIYQDVCYLSEDDLKPLVNLLTGNNGTPYYE